MTNQQPLVTVIVPTKNSTATLEACLRSIRAQTYSAIELIVVDNFSTDGTQELARKYADKVFEQGPERSAQVNFGVEQASGQYVYKVDSDFIVEPTVVEECVAKAREGFEAVIVHNSPDVRVSWIARVRKFEVDMYKYEITHSSARFVTKALYQKIGGFNPKITAGEDYDFQNKINRLGVKTGFVDAEALHLGEPKKLWPHLKKYYDYGKDFVNYRAENKTESKEQLSFFRGVYARNWRRFLREPVMAVSFVGYTFLKYAFGGMGYMVGRLYPIKPIEEGDLAHWIQTTDLNDGMVIGFYGGGNFGDELLLETLTQLYERYDKQRIAVYYSVPERFSTYHRQSSSISVLLDGKSILESMKVIIRAKSVTIGGGGLWGMDVNVKILALSLLLWVCRYIGRKNVYLVGVGYYSSTTFMGHVAAWFAAKAANLIFARDQETCKNFSRRGGRVRLDRDIVFRLPELDLTRYQRDLEGLESRIQRTEMNSFVVVFLRRFERKNPYQEVVENLIRQRKDLCFVLCLAEPKDVDPEGYRALIRLQEERSELSVIDFSYNPIALYLFLKKHQDKVRVIAPQFHVMLVAALAGASIFPLAYDNKCSELLTMLGFESSISIQKVKSIDLTVYLG